VPRSTVPAVTHVDYSARVQTVDQRRNPRFHALLRAFQELTDCPMLVNTSFNVRGEPIVCTPQDAYRCFLATDIDLLVLEDLIVAKEDLGPAARSGTARQEHLAQFQLD
jgi:carbamoyltransferase